MNCPGDHERIAQDEQVGIEYQPEQERDQRPGRGNRLPSNDPSWRGRSRPHPARHRAGGVDVHWPRPTPRKRSPSRAWITDRAGHGHGNLGTSFERHAVKGDDGHGEASIDDSRPCRAVSSVAIPAVAVGVAGCETQALRASHHPNSSRLLPVQAVPASVRRARARRPPRCQPPRREARPSRKFARPTNDATKALAGLR